MARDLDRKRPYGLIYPVGEDGAKYEQDRRLFDPQGHAIGEPPEPAPVAAAPIVAPPTPEPEAVTGEPVDEEIPVDRLTDEQLKSYVAGLQGPTVTRDIMLRWLADQNIQAVRSVDLLA